MSDVDSDLYFTRHKRRTKNRGSEPTWLPGSGRPTHSIHVLKSAPDGHVSHFHCWHPRPRQSWYRPPRSLTGVTDIYVSRRPAYCIVSERIFFPSRNRGICSCSRNGAAMQRSSLASMLSNDWQVGLVSVLRTAIGYLHLLSIRAFLEIATLSVSVTHSLWQCSVLCLCRPSQETRLHSKIIWQPVSIIWYNLHFKDSGLGWLSAVLAVPGSIGLH